MKIVIGSKKIDVENVGECLNCLCAVFQDYIDDLEKNDNDMAFISRKKFYHNLNVLYNLCFDISYIDDEGEKYI